MRALLVVMLAASVASAAPKSPETAGALSFTGTIVPVGVMMFAFVPQSQTKQDALLVAGVGGLVEHRATATVMRIGAGYGVGIAGRF